jgi:hypothetical protein
LIDARFPCEEECEYEERDYCLYNIRSCEDYSGGWRGSLLVLPWHVVVPFEGWENVAAYWRKS